MRSINKPFALLGVLGIVVTGLSLITYAGTCYVQTSSVPAYPYYPCTEGPSMWPLGSPCPGRTYVGPPFYPPIPTGCGCFHSVNHVGIGVSGNQASGRMEIQSVQKSCWTSYCCTLSGPHFDVVLPVADGIHYRCEPGPPIMSEGKATSVEATGGECTNYGNGSGGS